MYVHLQRRPKNEGIEIKIILFSIRKRVKKSVKWEDPIDDAFCEEDWSYFIPSFERNDIRHFFEHDRSHFFEHDRSFRDRVHERLYEQKQPNFYRRPHSANVYHSVHRENIYHQRPKTTLGYRSHFDPFLNNSTHYMTDPLSFDVPSMNSRYV